MSEHCRGTSLPPAEGMPRPDSPTRERGHCRHCGKDVALTISGNVRAHQPREELDELVARVRKDGSVLVSRAKAVRLVEAAAAAGYTFGRRQTAMGVRVMDLDE